MKLGIFAKTFPGQTPQSVLEAAAKAGYACVQYNMACSDIGALPQIIEPGVANAVHVASKQTGVEIAAVSATYNMVHPEPATREAGRRSFSGIAAAASRMGVRLLTVCTGSCDAQDQWRYHPDNDSEVTWTKMCQEFEHLIEIAERHDILIGVEPELANVVSSAGRARKLIDSMGSPRIRIVLDAANLFEQTTPEGRRAVIERDVDVLADRIEMAHAKDRNADGSFATVGTGVIDFRHYLGVLERSGFAGNLVTHGLESHEAAGVAAFLQGILEQKSAT